MAKSNMILRDTPPVTSLISNFPQCAQEDTRIEQCHDIDIPAEHLKQNNKSSHYTSWVCGFGLKA